jgi:hypothetical protein
MGFRLDAQQVEATFVACLSDAGDVYDMISVKVSLDTDRVLDHGELIFAMLMELPEEFRESSGGGWSFLQACDDRHGRQWTGLHLRTAQLFVLGQAAGLVECQLPREVWPALPGGMPYYLIKDRSAHLARSES